MSFLRVGIVLLFIIGITSCGESPEEVESVNESLNVPLKVGGDSEIIGNAEELSFPEALKLKRGLAKELANLEKQLHEKEKELVESSAVLDELKEVEDYRSLLEDTDAKLNESLLFWRTATRESFRGVRLTELRLESGEVFRTVVIEVVEDSELTFSHAEGTATVDIQNLPLGLRRNLIHEETVLSEIFSN